jgi:ferrous-iron efflux pump FieF
MSPVSPRPESAPRRGTRMAAAASLLLIVVKLTVGLLTGTVSVLASAVDSLLDFLISTFNAYAVRSAERPSDEAYNYGRGKMEGVAAFLEGLFILGSALYILREALIRFAEPGATPIEGLPWAIGAMAFSLVVTTSLVLYLRGLARGNSNLVLEADTVHYRMDIAVTAGVLLALALVRVTGWTWLDPAVAIAISLVVAKAALPLIRKGLQMLLDKSLDPHLVEKIRAAATGHSPRVTGLHELKTRRSGDTLFVEFHLVFDEDIRLRDAHRIADEIEMRIRALEGSRWVINIHLDPVDDSHRDRKLAKTGLDD